MESFYVTKFITDGAIKCMGIVEEVEAASREEAKKIADAWAALDPETHASDMLQKSEHPANDAMRRKARRHSIESSAWFIV